MAQATIRDVAREAAVSVASVSRVLNGRDNVRAELRQRVEQAARTLGYVPHAGARSLSMARSGAIGVVLPDLHGEFFSEILRGMDREASARGLQLLLSNMHADPRLGVEALHTMRGRVDGLVVMAPHVDPDRLFAHLPPTMPAVLVNCAEHHQSRAELRIDNEGAAATMVKHLVETGRRRIVHIAGPEGNADADSRRAGYEAAMARADLAPRVLPGTFLQDSGVAAAEALLPEIGSVDAIFAANDMMAIGALMRLRRAGVDVPGDVAIGGFDDVPLADLITPSLTTMRIEIAELGASALARVADIAAGGTDTRVERHVPRLVVRETTGSTRPPANGECREDRR